MSTGARTRPDGSAPPRRRSARAAWGTGAVVTAVVLASLVLQTGGALGALPRQVVGAGPSPAADVEHLRPEVRRAVERALAAAAADGVELRVTSGWRSPEHQRRLHEEAVATYGSPAAARRWVLPPEESEHVRGGAVDVGPARGAAWLEAHGAPLGLCRRYDNEPWHFELLAGPGTSGCPVREPHP